MKLSSGPILALGLLTSDIANAADISEPRQLLQDAVSCAAALKADRAELRNQYKEDGIEMPSFSRLDIVMSEDFIMIRPVDGSLKRTTDEPHTTSVVTDDNHFYLNQPTKDATELKVQKRPAVLDPKLWMIDILPKIPAHDTYQFLFDREGTVRAYSSIQITYDENGSFSGQTNISAHDAREDKTYSAAPGNGYYLAYGTMAVTMPEANKLLNGAYPATYNLPALVAAQTLAAELLSDFTKACEEDRVLIQAQTSGESK